MADAGVTAEHIRGAAEAMTRNPAAGAGSVEAGVANDLRDANTQKGLEKAALQDPSFTGIKSMVDVNVGYKDAQGNVVRTARENGMARTSNRRINLLQQFVEDGFNSMGANQQTLLTEVQSSILSSQEMSSHFTNLNQGQRQREALRMAREFVQDPNYRDKVVALLLQRADLTQPIEDNLTPVATKLEDLKSEQRTIRTDLRTATTAETNAKNKLNLYSEDPNPPAVGPANHGRFYAELITQQNTANQAKIDIKTLEGRIPALGIQLKKLETQQRRADEYSINYDPAQHAGQTLNRFLTSQGLRPSADIQTDIDNTEANLLQTQTDLTNAQTNLTTAETRLTQLNEERSRAEKALETAQTKRNEINEKLSKITKEVNEQSSKFNKMQSEKELKEVEWVRQLDNIIKDATADRLNQELNIGAQKVKERIEKRATDEKEEGKKRFWEYAKQQYIGPDGRPNRNVINPDRVALMRQGARMTFTWTENGVAHSERLQLNGAEQTLVDVMARGGFTQREIFDMIKDPGARTDMSNSLAQEILTTYLWSGGRLSRGDVIAIHRSEWGKGMVSKAVAGRTDLQTEIDNQIGKGVLNWRENILGQLGKIEWAKFAIILLIIAGVIGGVGFLKR